MDLNNIKKELSAILSGKVLIVGIGNQIRGDDAFGSLLAEKLEGRINADCLDASSSPENYIGKIIKLEPDVILFVDVVSMDEDIGTMRLIKTEDIPQYGFSTHNMSPRLMIENINSQISAKIFMLGIQPQSLEFGQPLSPELNEKLVLLEKVFIEVLGKDEKNSQ